MMYLLKLLGFFIIIFTDFDKWTLATTTFKGLMKDRWLLTNQKDESVKSFIEKRFGSSPEVMCRKNSGNNRWEIQRQN